MEKLDEQLFDFYCAKIFVEEECTKEYNNDFISKVQVWIPRKLLFNPFIFFNQLLYQLSLQNNLKIFQLKTACFLEMISIILSAFFNFVK